MDDERGKEVEGLEQKAKFTITTMECNDDDGNGRSKKILDNAAIQLQCLFQGMRDWLREHTDSMEVNERMECLKLETQKLLASTHDHLQRFSQREGVQAGSKKAAAAADKLVGYIQEGIQEVRRNECVRRSVHAVMGTVDTIRSDEQMKKGVRELKKGTLKATEAAFQGLKRVLDTDEDDSRKRQQTMKRITIYDVAKEAGVSLATVSRVINGSEVVHEDIRIKVQEVIEKLGYKSNAIAQGLALQKTTTIMLIAPEANCFYTGQIINGLIDVTKIYKYNIMLHTTTEGIAEMNGITENIIKSRVDGVVIFNDELNKEELNQLTRCQVPIVTIGNKVSDDTVGSVYVDYANLVYEYAGGCTKQGKKNIALVEDRKNPQMIEQLLDGLNRASEEQGMKFESFIQIPKEYRPSYLFLKKYMKQGIRHDVATTYRDSQAMVVMNTAEEAGISIPDGMELIYILDNKCNAMARPQISGFRISDYDSRAVAMRLLTKMLHDENEVTDKETELSYIYTPRKSTKQD